VADRVLSRVQIVSSVGAYAVDKYAILLAMLLRCVGLHRGNLLNLETIKYSKKKHRVDHRGNIAYV